MELIFIKTLTFHHLSFINLMIFNNIFCIQKFRKMSKDPTEKNNFLYFLPKHEI